MDLNYSEDVYRKEAEVRGDGKPSGAVRTRASIPSLSVEIYGRDIPSELLTWAEASVDTPFECLAHVRAFRPELTALLRHAVIRRDEDLVAVLSFYEQGRRLVVANRLIRLPDSVLNECATLMLEQNPRFGSVEFNDLYNGTQSARSDHGGSLTWATINCAETELPRSYDEYLQHFGSTSRKNLRYCARRLERESPDVAFRIIRRAEINEKIVAAVVELNHLRMASKGKSSGMDTSYTQRLTVLSQSHGVACVAADGNRIVAGVLCTRVGMGWTLHVIAHDPKYNHVRLGLLCLLKAIAEAIDGSARRFNFLWGDSDYKRLFGGKVSILRARRYYRNSISRLLAFKDMRDCLAQSARQRLSSWRARVRSARQ